MAFRDYRLMAFLVAIADAGSIRGAARRLGVSAPVVSTALADLEAGLGATLVRRGRQRVTLTTDGAAVRAAAAEMVAAADRALGAVQAARTRPRGKFAMTLPTELCMTWLPPILRAFEVAYPDIETSIHATDAVIDLQRSDHDLALRARYLLRPGGGGDTVSTLPLDLVATPAIARAAPTFAAARSRPIPLIGFSVRESSESVVGLRRDGRMVSIPAATRIWVNNGLLARELARAGFGAALVMRAIVADDLAQGRLTRVLPQYSFGGVAVRLLQRDAQPSAAARAFIGFVRERTGQPPTARLQ